MWACSHNRSRIPCPGIPMMIIQLLLLVKFSYILKTYKLTGKRWNGEFFTLKLTRSTAHDAHYRNSRVILSIFKPSIFYWSPKWITCSLSQLLLRVSMWDKQITYVLREHCWHRVSYSEGSSFSRGKASFLWTMNRLTFWKVLRRRFTKLRLQLLTYMKKQSVLSKVRTCLSWTYRLVKSQEIHEVIFIFHLVLFHGLYVSLKDLNKGHFLWNKHSNGREWF